MPDILRCLESMSCCEKVYVCDGGSKDGTREWLNNVKDLYNLELFDRPFDTMQNQRNFLLDKIKEEAWIINIDADEGMNPFGTAFFPDLIRRVPESAYQEGKDEKRVLTFDIPYLILKDDFNHYCHPYTYLRGKTFYHIPGKISFWHPYHCEPSYDRPEKSQYVVLAVPNRFAIFHYAYFNPQYMASRKKRLEAKIKAGEKDIQWEYDQWFSVNRDIRQIPEPFLVQ